MPNQITSKNVEKAREFVSSFRPTQEDKIRDKKTALVDGVYMKNHPIRKKMLSYLWGKYNQLPDVITDSLGKLYNAVERATFSPKNMKSLFDYTHDESTVYSDYIKRKYLTVGNDNTKEELENVSRGKFNAWHDTEYEGKNYYQETIGGKSYLLNKRKKYITNSFLIRRNVDSEENLTEGQKKELEKQLNLKTNVSEINTYEDLIFNSYGLSVNTEYNGLSIDKNKNYSLLKEWIIEVSKTDALNHIGSGYTYDEKDISKQSGILESLNNPQSTEKNDLLSKTKNLFETHKINTLIRRFHTSFDNENNGSIEYIDTAKTKWGNSHGRNLLKAGMYNGSNPDKINGYQNPYCRVWTIDHQYDMVEKLIRPFSKDSDIYNNDLIEQFRSNYKKRTNNTAATNGGDYLKNNTVLNKNGFVNITPISDSSNTDPRKTMFSIENLAWKDTNKPEFLDTFQKGPNGGRIMWFPPYDINFQENVNVRWDETQFIGRGESIYTYANTTRRGTLSFTLLIDHPSILNAMVMGSDKTEDGEDYENEILRFFAGCSIPSTKNDAQKDETEKDDQTVANTIPEKLVVNEDNAKKIKFYVFFPNNYSGNKEQISKNAFERDGASDSDWAKYLFMGHGIESNDSVKYGYEVDAKNSISDGVDDKDGIKAWDKDNGRWRPATGESKDKDRIFKYRVDFDLRQNKLKVVKNYSSYIDEGCFQLNSNVNNVIKAVNDQEVTDSFASVFYTLNKADNDVQNFANSQNIKEVKLLSDLLANKSNATIKINVLGMATNQDKNNSNELANRRATTLIKYLKGIFPKAKIEKKNYTISSVSDLKNINTKDAKSKRGVKVEIFYSIPEIQKQNNDNVQVKDPVKEEEKRQELLVYETNLADTGSTLDYADEGTFFRDLEFTDKIAYDKIRQKVKFFAPGYHSITPEGFNGRLNFLHQCTRQGPTIEADSSSNVTGTAGNLAFGRPPFCVLRIGDFINTKMLIESMSISYDKSQGMQWDLNPEGVGVQPMFARVNLGIIIIGGQSLEAPISRLNNAVSFNFYANTGVYDSRADRATNTSDGGIQYNSIFVTKTNASTEN